MKAAIVSNPLKDEGFCIAAHAAELLAGAGAEVLVRGGSGFPKVWGVRETGEDELLGASDVIVTLGGDGTILSVARGAAGRTPILGVNLGRKGFLTEVELKDMDGALKRLVRGDYRIDGRMMLRASVYDDAGRETLSVTALNDIYVCGAVSPRLVHVEATLGESLAGRYAADGVLVCSPTGSTGYSLSAGGPVVSPDVECMVLTPVCAHTLSAVPLVLPAGETVTLRAMPPTHEVRMNADGEERARLPEGWRVEVRRAETEAQFVRFGERDFYGLLRGKLVEWND